MAPKREPPSESSEDDPTQDEIAERAAAIRATWSDITERQRRVWHGRVEWALPFIRMSDCEPMNDESGKALENRH